MSTTLTDKKSLDKQKYFEETLSKSSIRPLQLAQIFKGIEKQSLEIGAIDPDTKHLNQVDMLYVCAIARHIKAQQIFEFGTYLGRTTYHLALGQEAKQVFTLDLDPTIEHNKTLNLGPAVKAVHQRGLQGIFFRDKPECANRVTQLHGDSRYFNYSAYHGKMDFIFIDGGHSYEFIANDTKHAFKMLKPGGVIVWHDFAPKSPDVVAFAQKLSATSPLFWVRDTSLLVYVDGVNAMNYAEEIPPYARSVIKP